MSANAPAAEPLPPVLPQHYRVVCGLAVAVIFLVLMEQGALPFACAAALLGAVGLGLRVPMSPLLILVTVVGAQLYLQYDALAWPRSALQTGDVLLCAATLAYVAGHYRLLSLWAHILPPDPRQRYRKDAGAVVPLERLGKVVQAHRPAALMSRGELAWFVVQLPLFAILAQGAWMLISPRRQLHDLPAKWVQLLQLAWGLALVLFVAAQFFRIWRLLQMDRATAKILLQDTLWHETRGEQRRIGRWLAWSRLRGKSAITEAREDENSEKSQ
jgi:hypothetical protein